MALLKKKLSIDTSHSRKSSGGSLNSKFNHHYNRQDHTSTNESFHEKPSSPYNMGTHGVNHTDDYGRKNSQNTITPNGTDNHSIGVTRNSSRLSSAPISSGSTNKRFSLSLRSLSSNSSLNNSKEDLNNHKPYHAYDSKEISSAGSSPVAVSDSKLIFDWDVTDPKAWTWQRVVLWLQLNDFNGKWINFFKRSQISGNNFLKLMAYDNFAKVEKYLPPSPNSSYNRFQTLLKRTMEHTVTYLQHSQNKSQSSNESGFSKRSNLSKHLKSNSDPISSIKNNSSEKLLDVSEKEENEEEESKLSTLDDEFNTSTNTLKASDTDRSNYPASNIYSSNTLKNIKIEPVLSKKSSVPKLGIPVPPTKTITNNIKTEHKNDPLSALYRRSFISIKGNSSDPKAATSNKHCNYKSSSDSGNDKNNSMLYSNEQTSKINSPITSPNTPKNGFFKKIHRHTSSDASVASQPTLSSKPEILKLDEKYLPKPKPMLNTTNVGEVKYIYCTKDRLSFIPINVSNANTALTFKAAPATHNNINHKNYSIFLTDFEFEIGQVPLDDDSLNKIIEHNFSNNFNKFFIKNHLKIQLNRNRSSSSIGNQPRKMSLKSNSSKLSFENNELKQVDYGAKIPTKLINTIENVHQKQPEIHKLKTKQSLASINSSHSNVFFSDNNNDSIVSPSFKVIRPDTSNKIDFNKKRETPFVNLNPSREAPPPPPPAANNPIDTSDSTIYQNPLKVTSVSNISQEFTPSSPVVMVPIALPDSIPSSNGSEDRRDSKPLHRPPPPLSLTDTVDSLSNTPNSTLTEKNINNATSNAPTSLTKPMFSRKPSMVALKPRKSTSSFSKYDHNLHIRLSRSNSSIQSSVYNSPPRLIKRESSRRIVSSALSANGNDIFDENNNISFKDCPSLSESDSDDLIKIKVNQQETYESDPKNDTSDINNHMINAIDQNCDVFDNQLDTTLDKDMDYNFKTEISENTNDSDSDDSGIAWIHKTSTNKQESFDERIPTDNYKQESNKKNCLLENELTENEKLTESSPCFGSENDSDDGIVWTKKNSDDSPKNTVSSATDIDFKTQEFIKRYDKSELRSLLEDEFDENDGKNQGPKEENSPQKEDLTGFSFDSESIMDSLPQTAYLNLAIKEKEKTPILERNMTVIRPSADLLYKNLDIYFPGRDLDKPIIEGDVSIGSPVNVHDAKFSRSNGGNLSSGSSITQERQRSIIEASTIHHSSDKDDYTFSSSTGTLKSSSVSGTRPFLNQLAGSSQNSKEGKTLQKQPRRTKTLRMLANEALETRKKRELNIKNKQYVGNSHLHPVPKLRRNDTTKLWGTKVIEITDKQNVVEINKNKNSKGQYREFAWIKGEIIGKGSFGCVYLGMNLTTGEMIAVKQVESSTSSQIEALRSEMETLKDLDHLNIVQYLGFEVKDSIYSLFLEYVAGGSLGALSRLYGKFEDSLIRFLNQQTLQGLSYLHNRGILHRDMKADNILLDLDGVCKISDFGISKKSNDIYSNSEMTMTGTIFWMAPEMVDTKQGYSAKVDIWSLGCIVLELFAGKRPWSNLEVVAAMFKIGKYKSAPPIQHDILPLISEEGRNFLDLCFQIDPEKRPTADYLLQQKIFAVDSEFDFSKTKLSKFINQNHKTMSLPDGEN